MFILVVVSTTTIVEFAPSFTISPTVLEHECSIAVQPKMSLGRSGSFVSTSWYCRLHEAGKRGTLVCRIA